MGYFVTGEGSIVVPAENLDAAYDALVELNRRDDLKSGGSSRPMEKPAESVSVADHPERWFSWVEWNYDEIYNDAKSILEAVGFETIEEENGSFELTYYDNKVGAEEHFIKAIAPYIDSESEMVWTGEDGEKWRWIFRDGKLVIQEAIITWD